MRIASVGMNLVIVLTITTGRGVADEPGQHPLSRLTVPVADTQSPPAAEPTKAELEIIKRLQTREQQLEREHRAMEQRLSQAEQLRQKGLAKNDFKLMEQAERMERQAVKKYEARISQFEEFSAELATSSARDAEKASVEELDSKAKKKKTADKKKKEKDDDDRPFRLFRRLRD